ncbi:MAG: hypothetical protein A2086_03615 [Spirochaetes bacterium GWD1_27_9]|nr:MAG: hypothetical protein A2Z98_10360 [Spirochaetes bacterium GWB1_27_13]OHD44379.1 MAG: hypothetical protein A2086_03615 [Spirochaetes bacterium GWD1_27_9]
MQKIIHLLFLSIILFSCKNYNNTLKEYLQSVKNSDFKKGYDLLSSYDKSYISYEEYAKNQSSFVVKYITKRMKYKILSSTLSETKNTVTIEAEISQINLVKLYDLLPQLLKTNISEKEVNFLLDKNWHIVKYLYNHSKTNYKLIYENNNWYIFLDFARKQTIDSLLKDGEYFYKNYNYQKSLEAYQKIANYDTNNIEAVNNIFKIEEKLSYIKDFIIFSYKINQNNQLNIKIKNRGTLLLKNIMINISFFDKNNDLIQNQNQQIVGNNSQITELGYKEEKELEIQIPPIYNKIECEVVGVEF